MLKPHDPIRRERLLEAANLVESGIPNIRFAMDVFKLQQSDCGFAGCIAGHIAAHLQPKRYFGDEPAGGIRPSDSWVYRLARDHLRITNAEAHDLFVPDNLETITPQQAAATLRHFAETGCIEYELFADGEPD